MIHDTHHDLTYQDKQTLQKREGGQKKLVLDYFKAHPNTLLTAEDVQQATGIKYLNSARRCCTDLTAEGIIQKTDYRKMGQAGIEIKCYIYKTLLF